MAISRSTTAGEWQFWIDRGGTFTDIVAQRPDHTFVVHKLLSENPDRYADAPLQGIRDLLGLAPNVPIPAEHIAAIKMGTTVATNALLERQGDRTLLLTTAGFCDALRIGYQNRPQIFARHIELPEMLFEQVLGVEERINAQGEVLTPITPATDQRILADLQAAYDGGIRACAIVLMHGYRYPSHEQHLAALAKQIGFTQISVSHQVSPLIKLISRGDTTVVDAYLSPILRRYVDRIAAALGQENSALPEGQDNGTRLMFMQSNGGLTDAALFQGKDSILSGPAGGIVGAVQTSRMAGYDKIIGFDMGGTSTDVSHYSGEYERTFETEVAGVRLRAPMMAIHTVAAGGGSILSFDGSRYRVGPASAGAYPGPACYRNGGPLAVTDCNVMVGKLQPEFFPAVFGSGGDLPLDSAIVRQKFEALAAQIEQETGDVRLPEEVATGFLAIAIEKMANAIKKISTQRGHDVSEYALCCFGGAGGQHACLIAEALGMTEIFIHPYAGVLSAYGMGLADVRSLGERSVEQPLDSEVMASLQRTLDDLARSGRTDLAQQGIASLRDDSPLTSQDPIVVQPRVYLRYAGTDAAIAVDYAPLDTMATAFHQAHQQRYGFTMPDKSLVVETAAVEVIGKTPVPEETPIFLQRTTPLNPETTVPLYTCRQWHNTPVYRRESLCPGDRIPGPALIIEPTGTNVIEPNWDATVTAKNHLILKHHSAPRAIDGKTIDRTDRTTQDHQDQTQTPTPSPTPVRLSSRRSPLPHSPTPHSSPDPVLLEIFNNLFRAIAEEMGVTLQNTSYSVNIKERLDFSCALFDAHGQLVANAPHIPVHLGSMGESVQSLIYAKAASLKPGDVYVLNNPYNGGTHLPDVTVITPVFLAGSSISSSPHPSIPPSPHFYVASRGHHADIGGITPGSMPPTSTTIEEEGVLIDNFQLVDQGQFRAAKFRELLASAPYPARNPDQNLADLQAQIAANEKGVQELQKMVAHYSLETVQSYMQHVQDNAEACVRQVLGVLKDGTFTYPMDDGSQITVRVAIDRDNRSATIDFTGTSPQRITNFNAPAAVGKAAVLYVFRTLVDDDIPLNAGCLKPLEIIIPKGSMLNPEPPAAVVAGNVETSQAITDALYGALGVMAASQGTMNNFTFGNAQHQYYETICGGSGAGPDFDGTDAVHTHMTNSRLTDPEVLEWRFPVLLRQFAIRPDSGGAGKHRGGDGIIRQIEFREPMTAAILSGHRQVPPFGLAGGESGAVGRNWVEHKDGGVEVLKSQDAIAMNEGDVFVIETPGGGGFGKVP
ncbi:MAG: hydantoinase B/oxoprolinase family protein [Cyanobacteria bacterium J06635_15]